MQSKQRKNYTPYRIFLLIGMVFVIIVYLWMRNIYINSATKKLNVNIGILRSDVEHITNELASEKGDDIKAFKILSECQDTNYTLMDIQANKITQTTNESVVKESHDIVDRCFKIVDKLMHSPKSNNNSDIELLRRDYSNSTENYISEMALERPPLLFRNVYGSAYFVFLYVFMMSFIFVGTFLQEYGIIHRPKK